MKFTINILHNVLKKFPKLSEKKCRKRKKIKDAGGVRFKIKK